MPHTFGVPRFESAPFSPRRDADRIRFYVNTVRCGSKPEAAGTEVRARTLKEVAEKHAKTAY
jgi:hypothetical protein